MCTVLYCHCSFPNYGHHFGLLLHYTLTIGLSDSLLHPQSMCETMVLISRTLCTFTRHEVMNMQCCACFLDCFYLVRSCVSFCHNIFYMFYKMFLVFQQTAVMKELQMAMMLKMNQWKWILASLKMQMINICTYITGHNYTTEAECS